MAASVAACLDCGAPGACNAMGREAGVRRVWCGCEEGHEGVRRV